MKNYTDLLALHQKEIDLTDNGSDVKITINSDTENITVLSGKQIENDRLFISLSGSVLQPG